MEYIKFLKSQPIILRLSTIQLIAYFGSWFTNVAIYTLLIELNVSALVIALTSALHFLPAVLQAPFVGVIIDKLNIKKLMLILLSVEAIATFFIIFIDSSELIWLLLLLVYIRMSSVSFYFTSEMSLLPQIISGKDLKIANEIHSIIWSFSYTAGMAISGLAVYFFGIKTALLIDVLLFIIAIFILFNTKIVEKTKESSEKFVDMIVEGLKYLKANPLIIHLIFIHSTVGFTAFDSLVTLLADFKYKEVIAISLAIGFINATRAISLMIAPIFLSKFLNHKSFFYILFLQGISILIWGVLQENFYISLIGAFLSGLFTTIIWSYSYTLLQESIEEKYYGRVIAYNDMIFMLVGVITSLSIGILADLGVELNYITYLIGFMFILSAIYYKIILKKIEKNSVRLKK